MHRFGYDDVHGVIIGEVSLDFHYSFHTKEGLCFGTGNFKTDSDAEAYIKIQWPIHFANGVEIRCYDEKRVA